MSNITVIGFPGRYVQGPGALVQLGALAGELGVLRLGVVADAVVRGAVGDVVEAAVQQDALGVAGECKLSLTWLDFGGECTADAISNLADRAAVDGCDAVVGLGGGKAIDTAKGVAMLRDCALIIVPTIASNDSPTSRLVVVYDDTHRLTEVRLRTRNPDVVLVDTEVICRAPAQFFAAGMGDALSKRFEAAQCAAAGGRNFFGARPPPLALTLGERCHAVIREHGQAALARVRSGLGPDESVESVVEATVLLSGIAFESGGLSLAHALNRGLTAHPQISKALHGEMVAFGTLVQLVAQEEPLAFIEDHARFTLCLGLPVHLGMLGATHCSHDELRRVAELTAQAPYVGHIRPKATVDRILQALIRADTLGRSIAIA